MVEEVPNRQQTGGADERKDLIRRDEKCDRVNNPKQPQDGEASQPITAAVGQGPFAGDATRIKQRRISAG